MLGPISSQPQSSVNGVVIAVIGRYLHRGFAIEELIQGIQLGRVNFAMKCHQRTPHPAQIGVLSFLEDFVQAELCFGRDEGVFEFFTPVGAHRSALG
ncbi:hypothetical protein D9M69_624710 [compost metagenome]